jgi:predicted dehydrogenase
MPAVDAAREVRRYAVVGTGARAEMYIDALSGGFPDTAALVGLCDTNRTRMKAHNKLLQAAGKEQVPTYDAVDFVAMLARERVGVVVVCTLDRVHDDYICAALEAGCDVVTEKPMTIDADRCRRILDTQAATGRSVTVGFNYRYNPVHEKVRDVLASGVIGDVASVHFEWLLDTRHGADYFRRWHRDKANSGGLMVHKATHHFDLVNWWLGSSPEVVFALGQLFFYGQENGAKRGLDRGYDRANGRPESYDDPFALRLSDSPRLRALYLEAEHEDGYYRDQNVFAPGVTIEDDMAVLVRYRSGTTMSYHLTAYSPWEGYRVMFNGSSGRLELEVTESGSTQSPVGRGAGQPNGSAVLHAGGGSGHGYGARLQLRPLWEPPSDVPLPPREGDHGGGDLRMLEELFGSSGADPLGRRATHRDGALSLLTGLAANESFRTGMPVRVDDLLDLR